jgi:hypothetical protein
MHPAMVGACDRKRRSRILRLSTWREEARPLDPNQLWNSKTQRRIDPGHDVASSEGRGQSPAD